MTSQIRLRTIIPLSDFFLIYERNLTDIIKSEPKRKMAGVRYFFRLSVHINFPQVAI